MLEMFKKLGAKESEKIKILNGVVFAVDPISGIERKLEMKKEPDRPAKEERVKQGHIDKNRHKRVLILDERLKAGEISLEEYDLLKRMSKGR